MRFTDASRHFDPTLAATFQAAVKMFSQAGLLDPDRWRALRLESRLDEDAWQALAEALCNVSLGSADALFLCVAGALESHRSSALPLGVERPALLGRVQKSDPLSKRAQTINAPLVSRRRALADTARMLRAESPFSDPMWGTFDPQDSRRDPFVAMASARDLACRLALGWTDNPREVWIILYRLSDTAMPKIPTLAHAASLYTSRDGVRKGGWHRHFQPAPPGSPWGRLRPVQEFRCEKGLPETVHEPVPAECVEETRRLNYA